VAMVSAEKKIFWYCKKYQ